MQCTGANVKRKRNVLTISQKMEILKQFEKNKSSVAALAKTYNIGKQTVRDIVKKKAKLQSFVAKADSANAISDRKSLKGSTFRGLDDAMTRWFLQKRSEGVPISGPMCSRQAQKFHEQLKIKGNFSASSDTADGGDTEDDNHLNEGELPIENIASIASQIEGLEEIDTEKIQEWIECDHEEKDYQILDDDYLNNQTSAESSDKSSDDDENSSVIKTSHREAGDALNILIQYFEAQPETDDIDLLQLRKMKEIIRRRIYETQKQKK
ncbi:hypothetical protein NQ318_021646 [Aromia moschata]|uniref:HTH psq-type domain-containing protein n=1 Tax=Aromia moschata TaxID=1265417 RepID=A0AAV8XTU7_9CUCU|nr:hypothetical protein NQ318_021646 [Aromia moschata]